MFEGNSTSASDTSGSDYGDGRLELLIRPASQADVQKFYPALGTSVRAWVGEVGGEARGIAGIAYSMPLPVVFSQFEEAYRSYLGKFAVWRLIRKIADLAIEMEVPVVAISEGGETKLLKRLGFVETVDLGNGVAVYEVTR